MGFPMDDVDRLESENHGLRDEVDFLRAKNAALRERLYHPCDGCPGCSSNDCPDALHVAQIDLVVWRQQAERLSARVGWLDLLDTEEGRRTYADEALRVELETARAENAALRERVAVLERVREAVCAVSWEHCNECRGPDGCVCGVLDLNAAVRAAKPAAQEGKEAADG